MNIIKSLLALSFLLLPVSALQTQLLEKKALTLEAAEKVADAAEAEAKSALYRMPLNIPGIRPANGTNKLAAQRQQMEVIQ